MAKKRYKKLEIKYTLELGYSPEGKHVNLDIDKLEMMRHDTSSKELSGTIRSNISVKFNTTNKTMGILTEEIEQFRDNKKLRRLMELSHQMSQLITDNTRRVFPEIIPEVDEVVSSYWYDNLIFDKQHLEYRTNIYNWATPEIEPKILDILEQMYREGLEEYMNIIPHFHCWRYFIGDKCNYSEPNQNTPIYSGIEFIDHRRIQLGIK